jgi:hypothetical protein
MEQAMQGQGLIKFAAMIVGVVLLAAAPHWCWLRDRSDSPWYPTMRLFRQASPGDWDDVFGRMAVTLDSDLKSGPVSPPSRASALPQKPKGALPLHPR